MLDFACVCNMFIVYKANWLGKMYRNVAELNLIVAEFTRKTVGNVAHDTRLATCIQ